MMMQKILGETIYLLSDRSIRDGDREYESAQPCHSGFRVFARIVRRMDGGVREERADSQERGGSPSVGEVARVAGIRDSQSRENSQQSGLRGDLDVCQGNHGEMALRHEKEANPSRFHSLVPAKREPELMPFVQ